MNNANHHIPAPSLLTQAHRDAMAYIQDLAITISFQGIYCVSAEYTGVGHGFRVNVLLFSELAKDNFKAHQSFTVYLPGLERLAGHNALEELQAIARDLEALLPGVVAE
ncbi:hypothetical protein [Halomonas llamarensis]|uniref:Uncharacterized protein n=1 Tax=Halomonas llamarensis TaxID=2945104 RepID=A0ABT0SNC6_9GAMM|nr:hypothetical protein [Halomonas llamarensis]MCL7929151.1 hypothetical protein [Halomonas llamarensis]